MSKYSNITIVKATSIIDEKIEEKVIDISIQVETLPTITTANLGKIYQYIGETTTDYTKGYFYEAKNTGTAEAPTYSWVQVDVGGGSSSVKIYDNDDDTTTEGKLWNCTDGKLVIDNLTANYSELEIYYSQKDTGEIQYYKINTELITLPKTNKGMFYIFDPTIDLYRLEKVEVTYNLKEDAAEGDKKAITITSTAGEESEVIIERVYGKE